MGKGVCDPLSSAPISERSVEILAVSAQCATLDVECLGAAELRDVDVRAEGSKPAILSTVRVSWRSMLARALWVMLPSECAAISPLLL